MNSEQQKKSGQSGDVTHQNGLVDQAKHVASAVADKVGEQVNHSLDAKRDQAIQKMGGVAEAIRWGSGLLKNVGPLGNMSERAADGVDDVASFFENKQVGDIVRDVERFARREPAMFLGAAFAIGLVGGRFLKSSGHREADLAEGHMGGYGGSSDDDLSERDLQSYDRGSNYRSGGSDYRASQGGSSGSNPRAGSPGASRLGGPTTSPSRTTQGSGGAGPMGMSGQGGSVGGTSGAIKPAPIVSAATPAIGGVSKTASAPPPPLPADASAKTSATSATLGSSDKPKTGIAGS